MENDTNHRLNELWESFKRLPGETEGLEVGSGRFVLIPPGTVRLSGFRARLNRSPDGPSVVLVADTVAAMTEVHPPAGSSAPVRKDLTPIDLADGFGLDGKAMKHASDLAQALVHHMETLLERASYPGTAHSQNGSATPAPAGQPHESRLER